MPNRQVGRPRGNGWGVLARSAVRGLASGTRIAKRVAKYLPKKKASAPQRKDATGDGGVVTNQFDSKLSYRRKGGKRKRSGQSKFAKRVAKVIAAESDYDSTFTLTHSKQVSVAAGFWGYYNTSLMGINGTVYTDDDYYQIEGNYISSLTNPTNRKLFLKSGHLDLICTNTGGSYPMMVYAHTLVPKRDITIADCGTSPNNAIGFFQAMCNGVDQPGPGAISRASYAAPGVDIWSSPNFRKQFTILQTRKTLLSNGQSLSMDLGSIWNKTIKGGAFGKDMQGIVSPLVYKKGVSKILFFTFYAFGNDAGSTGASTYPATALTFQVVKTFNFKIPNIGTTSANEADNTGAVSVYNV